MRRPARPARCRRDNLREYRILLMPDELCGYLVQRERRRVPSTVILQGPISLSIYEDRKEFYEFIRATLRIQLINANGISQLFIVQNIFAHTQIASRYLKLFPCN